MVGGKERPNGRNAGEYCNRSPDETGLVCSHDRLFFAGNRRRDSSEVEWIAASGLLDRSMRKPNCINVSIGRLRCFFEQYAKVFIPTTYASEDGAFWRTLPGPSTGERPQEEPAIPPRPWPAQGNGQPRGELGGEIHTGADPGILDGLSLPEVSNRGHSPTDPPTTRPRATNTAKRAPTLGPTRIEPR